MVEDDAETPNPGYYATKFSNIDVKRDQFVCVPVFGENERCIAIKAGMRAGKTTALKRFLSENVTSKQRVLLTTGRIQQALSLMGTLNGVDQETGERSSLVSCDGEPFRVIYYKDKEEVLSSDLPGLYICQWESLHCLLKSEDMGYTGFDYLICDEIRATLNQSCVGVTNKDFMRLNLHLFKDVCQKTKCLLLDADLLIDDMIERFALKKLGGVWDDEQIRVEIYTHQSMPRNLELTDDNIFFVNKLRTKIAEAKEYREQSGMSRPVFVACRSKRGMGDILTLLTGTYRPEFLKDGIIYFSSNSSNEEMALWENIDAFISQHAVDVILTTSKVTVCADMNTPVTSCFIMANSHGGCVVRDLYQTIGRARQPITNEIVTLITKPSDNVPTEPKFNDIKEGMVKDGRARKKYIQLLQIESGFDIEDDNRFNKLVLHRSPDWMLHLACGTEMEQQNNRHGLFHTSLIRTANYKGWTVSFNRMYSEEDEDEDEIDDQFKIAHKATGKEIKERDKALLESMKALSVEELSVMANTKHQTAEMKEKSAVASFLVRFPDFIPHITLDMQKYFMSDRAVFERVRSIELDEETLKANDVKRLMHVFKQKMMERTALMFPVTEKIFSVVMSTLGLEIYHDFLNAPQEETNAKHRDLDNYYLDKTELSVKYDEIKNAYIQITSDLGLGRNKRITDYKDKGEGAIKVLGKMMAYFGRKIEGCKDRTVGENQDRRLYRIVQNTNFFQLNPHYVQKEWGRHHNQAGGLAYVIRQAKLNNPELLKVKQQDCVVTAIPPGGSTTKGKKRKIKETTKPTKKDKAKRRDVDRIDVPDIIPEPKEGEVTGLTQELLGLLNSQ